MGGELLPGWRAGGTRDYGQRPESIESTDRPPIGVCPRCGARLDKRVLKLALIARIVRVLKSGSPLSLAAVRSLFPEDNPPPPARSRRGPPGSGRRRWRRKSTTQPVTKA